MIFSTSAISCTFEPEKVYVHVLDDEDGSELKTSVEAKGTLKHVHCCIKADSIVE